MFDNISYISDEVSDLLCRAVTGTGFSKRELYTDDEDIILKLKHCVALNGINLVATRPDLLERSILFELERIPEEARRQERELFEELRRDLPFVLGGIFDVLARALNIHPTIKLDKLPRMADFAVWGCAIAEAIGYTREEFLQAYHHNIESQNEEVINENVIAGILLELMKDKDMWTGTPTELYAAARDVATWTFNINPDRDKTFPKAENAFMRKLNYLKQNLEAEGLRIHHEKGRQRRVFIQKQTSENSADAVVPSTDMDLG